MSKERWRWVVGYEGLYMVSDLGRIMSVPKKTHYGHVMKTRLNWAGYETVCLCKQNVKSSKSVHRIVAQSFIQNPMGKEEVNHIDGDRSNNVVKNLEWVTRSENERHAYSALGKKPNAPWAGKPNHHKRKFSADQIRAIRSDPRPLRSIGRDYGVSKTTIRDIKHRKHYTEVV